MDLDWTRFKRALGPTQHDNDNREKLLILSQEADFILKFLSSLYNALCRCQTIEQCSALYPEAGLTLSIAAVHPLIAVHPEIARRLVSCLLEYSKFEHSRRDQQLRVQPTSIAWCITRLRRLTHASSFNSIELERNAGPNDDSYVQQRVDRLICELDDSILSGSLRHEKISQLLDISVLLVYHDQANSLIEKLVACAIELLERDYNYAYWGTTDPPPKGDNDDDEIESDELVQQIKADKYPISQKFMDTLLHQDSENRLWIMYQQWSWHFKSRIWRFYDQVLKGEVLNTVKLLGHQPNYISSSEIQTALNDMSFVQTLLMDGQHFRKVYTILSESVISTGDWRTFRVLWHLFDIILVSQPTKVQQKYLPAQLDSAVGALKSNLPTPKLCQELQRSLKMYIYAGTLDDMLQRRCHAWILPLMYPTFVYKCTLEVVRWCSVRNEHWNENVEDAWQTMAWLACPSDDDRLCDTLERLRSWITSLKGFCDNDVDSTIQLFSPEWHNVFNGNIILALITTLSAMSLLEHWRNDDYLKLLDTILRYGVTPNGHETTPSYNSSIVYLFNDYLPMWESLLSPTMAFDNDDSLFSDYSLSSKIRQITTYVNSIIS